MKKGILKFALLLAILPGAFLFGACGGGNNPEVTGFKVYIDDNEVSVTNNTVYVDIDDVLNWHDDIDIKITFDNGTSEEVDLDDGTIEITGIPANWAINSNGYNITFSYEDYESITVKVVVTQDVQAVSSEPTKVATNFVYNGQEKTGVTVNYDSGYYLKSGNIKATNAGSYTAVFGLHDGYTWIDGTTEDKTITWSIARLALIEDQMPKLAGNGTFTYNGAVQFGVENAAGASFTATGDVSAVDVGDYTTTFTIGDNYTWVDGTTNDLTFNWSITRLLIAKPTVSNVTFNGQEQRAFNLDENLYEITGQWISYDAGTYAITVAIRNKNNMAWLDNTTDDVNLTWTIAKKRLQENDEPKAVTDPSLLVYTGSEIKGVEYSETYAYSSDGGERAINAGTYTAVFTLNPNCEWSDGTTEQKVINWAISKAKLTKPTVVSGLVYNGQEQLGVIGHDANTMDGGPFSYTNAGSYSMTVGLKDTWNYTWADDSIERVELTVVIARKAMDASIEPQAKANKDELVYNGEQQCGYIYEECEEYGFASTQNNTISGMYPSTCSTSFAPSANYTWADGTIEPKTITWTIIPMVVADPVAITGLVYNGQEQLCLANYEEYKDDFSIFENSDSPYQTNAGSYSITLSFKHGGYVWESGKSILEIDFTIARKAIETTQEPTYANGYENFVYNGSTQMGVTNIDTDIMSVTISGERLGHGIQEPTDADTYTASVRINSNYTWNDGTTEDKEFTWTIGILKLEKPTSAGNLDYTGNEQCGIVGFDTRYMTVVGTANATQIDEYHAEIYLDFVNVIWADDSTEPVVLDWEIVKATNSFVNFKEGYTFSYGEVINIDLQAKFGEIVYKYARIPNDYNGVDPLEYTNGLPTTLDAGTYQIIASVEAGEEYSAIEETAIGLYIEKIDFDASLITFSNLHLDYTGEMLCPTVHIPEIAGLSIVTGGQTIAECYGQIECGTYRTPFMFRITEDCVNYYPNNSFTIYVDWSIDMNIFTSIKIDGQTVSYDDFRDIEFLKHGTTVEFELQDGWSVEIGGEPTTGVYTIDASEYNANDNEYDSGYKNGKISFVFVNSGSAMAGNYTKEFTVGYFESITVGTEVFDLAKSQYITYELAPKQTNINVALNNLGSETIYFRETNADETFEWTSALQLEAGEYNFYLAKQEGSFVALINIAFLQIKTYNPFKNGNIEVSEVYSYGTNSNHTYFDLSHETGKYGFEYTANGFIKDLYVEFKSEVADAKYEIVDDKGQETSFTQAVDGTYYIVVYSGQEEIGRYPFVIEYNFYNEFSYTNGRVYLYTRTGEIADDFANHPDGYTFEAKFGETPTATYTATKGLQIVPMVLTAQIEGVTYTYEKEALINYSEDLRNYFEYLAYPFQKSEESAIDATIQKTMFTTYLDSAELIALQIKDLTYTLKSGVSTDPQFEIVKMFNNTVCAFKVTIDGKVAYFPFNFEGKAEADLTVAYAEYRSVITASIMEDIVVDFNTKSEITVVANEALAFNISTKDYNVQITVTKGGDLVWQDNGFARFNIDSAGDYVVTFTATDGSTKVVTIKSQVQMGPLFTITYGGTTLTENYDANVMFAGDFVMVGGGQTSYHFAGYFGKDNAPSGNTVTISGTSEIFGDKVYKADKTTRITDLTNIELEVLTDTAGTVTGIAGAKYSVIYILIPYSAEMTMEIGVFVVFDTREESNQIVSVTYGGKTYEAVIGEQDIEGDFVYDYMEEGQMTVNILKAYIGADKASLSSLTGVSIESPHVVTDSMGEPFADKTNATLYISTDNNGMFTGINDSKMAVFTIAASIMGQTEAFLVILICADAPSAS